ncbi:MAG: hypothetical protein R3E12_04660 [Candidatus Eisenbacteria bacterium]
MTLTLTDVLLAVIAVSAVVAAVNLVRPPVRSTAPPPSWSG